MNTIPELIPISELRQRQSEVLNQLAKHPVVLTQHGRATAVLVSPEMWNQLLEELDDLRDALDAAEALQELDHNQTIDFDEYLSKRGERVPAEVGS